MIKKIAWDTFKNTGDINSFLEYKQIENIENNLKKDINNDVNIKINNEINEVENNAKCKNEGSNTSRK